MSLTPHCEVDARDIARLTRVLRGVDKDLANELPRTIKPAMKPIAGMIASKANAFPAPMSGMLGRGSKRFAPVRATVHVTPGYSKKNINLVEIRFASSGGSGMFIADMAGRVTRGKSARGQSFIRTLDLVIPGWPNGGRFFYRAFKPYRKTIYTLAENLLERWVEKINRKLESD